jgi:FKBP-type peptidyl-prolyl cis-trans isomerase FklB
MRTTLKTLSAILFAAIFLPGVLRAQTTPAASTPPGQPAATSQSSGQSSGQSPAQGSSAAKPAASQSAAKPAASSAAKKPASAAAAGLTTQKQKSSYAVGVNIGRMLSRDGLDANAISSAAFLQGVRDILAGKKPALTDQELQAALVALKSDVDKAVAAKNKAAGAKNREAGQEFLDANKSKAGVVVLPSGLQYKIITEGTGPKPAAADTVACNYRGTLVDGTEFDSSAKHGGQPAKFQVGGVIKGWTEALQLMPVGSKWELYIPPDLAYGDNPRPGGPIGPGSTLVFQVELVSIEPKPAPPAPK